MNPSLSVGQGGYNILPDAPWCLPQVSYHYEPGTREDHAVYASINGAVQDELVCGHDEGKWLLHFFKVVSEVCLQSCLKEKDISPFVVAAWIHAIFSRIHPFTVSVLSPYFIKCTENNLRMGMAMFPTCLHHCHSFTLATLSSMSVHTSERNTCRLYSK
jgi:hypothetical protein